MSDLIVKATLPAALDLLLRWFKYEASIAYGRLLNAMVTHEQLQAPLYR